MSAILQGTGARDLATRPFHSRSPFNRPLGANATYAAISSGMGGGFSTGNVNTEAFTTSTWIASSLDSDPLRLIYLVPRNNITYQRRIPNTAQPSEESDHHMAVVDPTHTLVFEMYDARKRVDLDWNANGGFAIDVSLTGNGTALTTQQGWTVAAGCSQIGGVIRDTELADGINHRLMFATDPKMWNRSAAGGGTQVWPATAADGYATDPEPGGYGSSGNLYMGSIIALPPSVNILGIGLTTTQGVTVARAMQDYGAVGVDSAGVGSKIVFRYDYADRLAGHLGVLGPGQGPPWWDAFLADLNRIAWRVQVVTNSHTNGSAPTLGVNEGIGGGAPRVAFLPD